MGNKVLIGMSGGVDSSVAAYLLQKQGYEVTGSTMILTDTGSDDENVYNAKAVCEQLNIPFITLDFRQTFSNKVIDYFCSEYINGRTPNPCVECNKYLKFGAFFEKAMELGFDYVATGHYAKIIKNPETNLYEMHISNAEKKDQSYFLYGHTQKTLSKTLMPLGEYNKPQILEIASQINLKTANRPESQEICFIHDDDYVRFITDHTNHLPIKGDFIDINGNIIGKHNGIINYTIGQRKGLGAFGRPMFVMKIDSKSNKIVLGEKGMEYGHKVYAESLNFLDGNYDDRTFKCTAKNRYQAQPVPCVVEIKDNHAIITYDEPVRAITPGQAIVFYDGNILLGGGTVYDSE